MKKDYSKMYLTNKWIKYKHKSTELVVVSPFTTNYNVLTHPWGVEKQYHLHHLDFLLKYEVDFPG